MRRIIAMLLAVFLSGGLFLPAMADTVITLTFAGDVTLGGEEASREKPNSFYGYAEREGYDWFFRNMQELFTTDDLTLVNLEGPLTNSVKQENTQKTFRFRGPTKFARILTVGGIEACAISNNHILDFGQQGYESTLAALEAEGILYCGNEHSFIFEKNGIRIGFFALGNTFMNSYGDTVRQEIARMRADGVNAIVCSFHTGQEYTAHRRDWDQERYSRRAVRDWGADLVIMHHPHVVQGVDRIDQRYVFYSLGNFCFGGNLVIRSQRENPDNRTLETMVVQMDLHFDEMGNYLGQEGRIYPCYSSSSATRLDDPNDFQPKFVYGQEALGVVNRIQNDTTFDLGLPDEKTGILTLPYLVADDTAKE